MNVLHINSNYAYTWLHQKMVEHLQTDKVINTVFAPVSGEIPLVVTPNKNVSIVKCFSKYDRLFFDYKQRKILRALEKTFDVRSYNLVHAYTLFTDGNCARRIKKQYGIPYVVAIRNVDVNTFFKKVFYLRKRGVKILCDASAVFFLSDAYQKEVITRYVPMKYRDAIIAKSYVIPNGIDDFWLDHVPEQNAVTAKTEKVEQRIVNAIYAGRIDKNKNIPTTQKALHILKQKGYKPHLTVVGSVKDEVEFARINNDELTTCFPAAEKETLIDQYRNNDVFVMPSFHESFGLVYAEALSQGLPVIYSKGQGFDGQFPDGYIGWAVHSNSPKEIAEAIEQICKDYNNIALKTIQSARRFDWTSISQKYLDIYTSILNR